MKARLTYLAVHRWYGWSGGRLLVLDIGGGSMEIVLGQDAEPELAVSLPLGPKGETSTTCAQCSKETSRHGMSGCTRCSAGMPITTAGMGRSE